VTSSHAVLARLIKDSMGTMLYATSKNYQATKLEIVETEATGL